MGIVSGGGGGAGFAIPLDKSGGSTRLVIDAAGDMTLDNKTGGTGVFTVSESGANLGFAEVVSDSGFRVRSNFGQVLVQTLAGATVFLADVTDGLIFHYNAAPADGALGAGDCALWYDSTNGASKLMVKAAQADGTIKSAAIALA